MILFKKLIFAPFFLIIFGILIYQLASLLGNYDFIFSLSADTLIQLIMIAVIASLVSFLFILFSTLASDWRISLPIALIAATIPLIFMDKSLGLIFGVSILVSMILVGLILDSALRNYLNFQPSKILGPSVKYLSGFLVFAFCLIFFLSINQVITQKGFEIPDSLIDTALKMAPVSIPPEQDTVSASTPTISQEQIDLLKKNPDLLRQSGLDLKILDTLNQPKNSPQTPQNLTNSLIKQTVKDQIQTFIKPYLGFIPAGLTILLFLTLQFFVSLTNALISPLFWLTFLILEKTGFTKYEIETRQVKKLVV